MMMAHLLHMMMEDPPGTTLLLVRMIQAVPQSKTVTPQDMGLSPRCMKEVQQDTLLTHQNMIVVH
jgi:hypothetical protein